MALPDSTFALVMLVVLLVPGFVYAVVRTTLQGFRADDKTIDTRIAQALLFSIVLDAIYLVVVFSQLGTLVTITDKTINIVDPVALGWTIIVGAVLIPALIAAIVNSPLKFRRRQGRIPLAVYRRVRYSSVPTAWDYAGTIAQPRFIRILLPDGRFIGGWWGPESYVSTYPEPRDIFISFPYEMTLDGRFGAPKVDSDGVWLTVPDGTVVEWVNGPEDSANDGAAIEEGKAT